MRENKEESGLFFTQKLLEWDKKQNIRDMPWKKEKDPYKIWISEIILQQTRVEQGTAYYNRFIKKYPDVTSLAKANENEVFKLWEGLGYYSRCRNLIATAKHIAYNMNGLFPKTYEEILMLKGVGPYTAAAISSFAFNLPHAVVDGNVMRVLSRYFHINTPIDSTEGKKVFFKLANRLIHPQKAAIYNQAIMDLGATVCKPQSPDCQSCLLSAHCMSFIQSDASSFPVKSKSLKIKKRYFNYFIIEYDGGCYVRKRVGKDIWQQLHEFVLFEANELLTVSTIKDNGLVKMWPIKKWQLSGGPATLIQKLTHQHVHGRFFHFKIPKPLLIDGYEWKNKQQLKKLAFPRLITSYLSQNPIFCLKSD